MCGNIFDNAWSQATLPFRVGGLGLPNALHIQPFSGHVTQPGFWCPV